eukprot:gb/GECG01003784.1/.p1 GENE.gb/GECG01003784.1/~~gb/GECG01003784.1/.p1  ORF type:complete len:539 (+),score=62.73 gb/GECG01003784.1/:1-1617(+)
MIQISGRITASRAHLLRHHRPRPCPDARSTDPPVRRNSSPAVLLDIREKDMEETTSNQMALGIPHTESPREQRFSLLTKDPEINGEKKSTRWQTTNDSKADPSTVPSPRRSALRLKGRDSAASVGFDNSTAELVPGDEEEEEIDEKRHCGYLRNLPAYPTTGSFFHNLHHVLNDTSTQLGWVVSCVVLFFILVSIVNLIVSSYPSIRRKKEEASGFFIDDYVEIGCLSVFIIEYTLRLVTAMVVTGTHKCRRRSTVEEYDCSTNEEGSGRVPLHKRFVAFLIDPMNLIDLIAIVPSLIELLIGSDETGFVVLRVLRFGRIIRLMRLSRGLRSVKLLKQTLMKSKDALLLLGFYLAFGCLLFGTIIYFAEVGTYDKEEDAWTRPTIDGSSEEVSPFTDIPVAIWWVITTATTVGYGDLVPTTLLGRIVGATLMLVGVIVLALPISIVGNAFSEVYEDDAKRRFRGKKENKTENPTDEYNESVVAIAEFREDVYALREQVNAMEEMMKSQQSILLHLRHRLGRSSTRCIKVSEAKDHDSN